MCNASFIVRLVRSLQFNQRVPVTSLGHCPLIGPLDDSTLANGKINGISWGLMGLSCKTMEFNRFNGISWDVLAEISRKMVGI